jgi:hypothetical protein
MSLKRNAITFALLTTSFSSMAALQSFDSRSHAMGGTGVSSADYLTAPFHNPALGARYNESDDVGVLIPSVGAQVSDQDEMISGLEDFSDTFDALDAAINSADQSAIDSAAKDTANSLENLQGDKAHVEAGVGMAIAIPNQYLSVNIYGKAYADAVVIADIDSGDIDDLENLTPSTNPDDLLNNSRAITMGVSIIEGGVSVSKSFDVSYGTWYVGLTPKYQMINTINYVVDVNNYEFDDWDNDEYQNDEGNMNVDFGMAFEMPEGFVFGLTGRNLIENKYETELVNSVSGVYKISPVYTAAASFNHSLFTAALDVDLNENERYETINGAAVDTDNTQMAGVGLEFNAWGWAQLRAGYQHDIAGNLEDQFTAGLGLSPFDTVHIDVSGSYAGENQFGAVVQTYFTF